MALLVEASLVQKSVDLVRDMCDLVRTLYTYPGEVGSQAHTQVWRDGVWRRRGVEGWAGVLEKGEGSASSRILPTHLPTSFP